METESPTTNHQTSFHKRLLHAIVPVLLIGIGYVDPGKWATSVEGGARFGVDFIVLMLVFNFAAILCQYLSARIAVVTGRDLAKICSEEYDKVTCIFLGVQAELSMIALDLAMIVGTAHGLNLILGVDLFTSIFFTTVEAFLFPLFATLLESGKAKFLCICMASFILLSYVFGVIISQPEISTPMGGMLSKSSGEIVFVLMSLLGANIMPHSFYLHSSIVQQDQGSKNVSKGALCHDHFFAILCIFSGIFLVNYVLMNLAANVFYSTGLVLLTFQDAMSLMDQAFRSSIVAPFALVLVMFLSNQVGALTWNLARQVVLHDLLRMDIPGWLHHATIRLIAVVAALCCVSNSGAEGLYQMLIFTQVMVALLLPSSVIPLFRISSSRSIMGVYKVSQFVEFLALTTFIGMLGLNIIFVIEMIFGNSDWVSNLRWSMGNSVSVSYVILLVVASISLCLMLWLAATPLKSASFRLLEAQAWNWEIQSSVPESSAERNKDDVSEIRYRVGESIEKQESTVLLEKSFDSHPERSTSSPHLNLPETLLDTDSMTHLTPIEEKCPDNTYSSPAFHPEESATTVETAVVSTISNEVSKGELLHDSASNAESVELVEKTLSIEGDVRTEKDEEGDSWEPEESFKGISSPPLEYDGPGSFRSLSGKSSDDVGSGTGSLSRLAGLGRAARRQLTATLDEFWGQLFDFHGQATKEARAKKLDVLLGVDSKVDLNSASGSLKLDNGRKECTGYFPSLGGSGSDSVINSSLYDSPKSSYEAQRGASSFSNHMQLLNAYMQNSSRNAIDYGERRYSRVRIPPSSDGNDQQPATIHGYQFASYLNRIAKERNSGYLNDQIESLSPKSTPLLRPNYIDPRPRTVGQRPQSGLSAGKPPGFPDLTTNNSVVSERQCYERSSPGLNDNVDKTVNAKKYYSLPDISGLSIPNRDLSLSQKSAQRDNNPMGYEPSVSRTRNERSLYSNTSLRAGAPLAFGDFSPSNAFSSQISSSSNTGSLWSRQPFEQFGVADKTRTTEGERVGNIQNLITQDTASDVDLEAKLLQSFRHCILKLLKLEGSDWLFGQNDGADEDLIDRMAARERFICEVEAKEINQMVHMRDAQFSSDRKLGSALRNEEIDYTKIQVTSFPHCGEGCIWRVDLVVSFGVWCIHRVLDLSLMESRPELWGKYTYVLNRLQGIIDMAFSRPRSPMTPCFCLQIPVTHQQRSSPPISNGNLPPPAKQGRGKSTTAAMLLDMIKDVELAISCRKGRTGTAAGDVAFPKGKENLASVLKRYKRRLSSKSVGTNESGSGLRKVSPSAYGS